jgi:putative redox protein
MKTITNWIREEEFESRHEDQLVKMDGNKKNGASPKSLLLSGLAGCSGIDVVDILRKQKIRIHHFEITVETEQTETHPKVFKDIKITYRIKAEPADENKVRRAISLSLEKYCGVSAMLRKHSDISHMLVME